MPPGGGGGPGPTPVPPGAANVGITPLRRLTSDQYRNTVRDLLKMPDARTVVATTSLPADDSIGERFTANIVSSVNGLDADKYADIAETLARKAATNLQPLLPCPATGGEACATMFIQTFGKKAFRRPLLQAEVDRYKKVFVAGGDFNNGIRLVIQAFLQSPKMLYLIEPMPAASAGKVMAVDSWVMASRLSYFFLESMPDDALFTAAEANQLTTPDQIATQARRLMGDPRFAETLTMFHDQWLELDAVLSADKNPMMFAAWTPAVQAAAAEQTRRFVQFVMGPMGDGKLETLLTGTFTFMNGPLYPLYGLTAPAGANATTWARVELKPTERAGILTHVGVMAGLAHEDRTSYILRGKLVREALLCGEVASPPPGIDASESNIPPTASARERSTLHRTKPECAACHAMFDPLGFAFEAYDAIGRFRANVDSSGDLTGTSKLDGPVTGAIDLVKKVSTSDEIKDCMVKQWLRFGLGRPDDPTDDKASITAGITALGSGGKISDMLVALVRSDAFRHQKVRP